MLDYRMHYSKPAHEQTLRNTVPKSSPSDSLHSVINGENVDPLTILDIRECRHTGGKKQKVDQDGTSPIDAQP